MATTKQQLERFTKAVAKAMAKAVAANAMREYGETAVDLVVARTRGKGQGVPENGGRAEKLTSVTKEYAARRKKMQRHPDAAGGRKSNLTLTGEMLDSLTVTKARSKSVEIGWTDSEQRDKAKGNELGSYGRAPNPAYARPFLNLTTREVNLISKELDKKLNKEAKKI